MVAYVHARIEPDVQGVLRVRIVFELDGIDKPVSAFKMIGLQFGGERSGDFGAILVRRKAAGSG